MQQFAKLAGYGRNAHRHDRVTGFGRCQQMADRTDAADSSCDARHLIERTALGEFFETAHLRDMEFGPRDVTVVVELDRDLRVSFDAAHGIDGDALHQVLLIRTSHSGSHPASGLLTSR